MKIGGRWLALSYFLSVNNYLLDMLLLLWRCQATGGHSVTAPSEDGKQASQNIPGPYLSAILHHC